MGALADLGIHKTDLICYLIGQNIVEVMARLEVLDKRMADGSPIGVDDNAFCFYRLQNGACGTMTACWTNYGQENNSTILYGTKGTLRIYDDPAHSLVLHRRGGETVFYDVDQIQTNDCQTRSGVIDLFVDWLYDKPDVQPISGESVLPAMRAIFAVLQADEHKCAVRVAAD